MKNIPLKTLIRIGIMMVLLLIAFTSGDVIISNLSASFAIIIGAAIFQILSNENSKPYEQ